MDYNEKFEELNRWGEQLRKMEKYALGRPPVEEVADLITELLTWAWRLLEDEAFLDKLRSYDEEEKVHLLWTLTHFVVFLNKNLQIFDGEFMNIYDEDNNVIDNKKEVSLFVEEMKKRVKAPFWKD